MAVSYSGIFLLFHDEFSVLNRGEQHLNSNDVIQFAKNDTHYTVKVRASMKKTDYTVEVSPTLLKPFRNNVTFGTVKNKVESGFQE